ncbi:MAG TPA: beta-ketoacyl synthase N-terminal-like domain-containing protein [Anaerolineales bacterium]|nr:beta-ketoacyl synthase N-terminal-like domain-containing protein [Anaerolineales bacterium]
MTEVIIAGVGQTDVGEHWDISLRELALRAIEGTVRDAGGLRPGALYVANMLSPALSGQSQLAALIADFAGLSGIEAVTVEAAGASGGAALRAGYMAVLSGQVDSALVVGVEKVTDTVGGKVEKALATAMDADYEAEHGLTPTAQAALLMARYLHETGAPREAFAGFAVTAHANGAGNPHAMFRKAIKPETYQRAGIVSPPLNLFDAAPFADGAAAVLLTREGILAERLEGPKVRISGSSLTTDTLTLHDRRDPLDFQAVRASVEAACRQAGVMPGDVDLFEIYDAFSIYAALSLEAAGFAGRGRGWELAQNGAISLKGKLPLMTFGGLKARGNPGGATGIYQAVEATLQLRGLAGPNQVANARRALIQCLGGPASTVATHVLESI